MVITYKKKLTLCVILQINNENNKRKLERCTSDLRDTYKFRDASMNRQIPFHIPFRFLN